MYEFKEELERVWEQRFEHEWGCLRDEVLRSLDSYLNCGIIAHGAARARCPECNNSILVAFSCKKRGVCPSCGAKRAVIFAEHIAEEVLKKVPHRHVTWTIPKIIRPYFKFKRMNSWILYRAAWETVKEMYRAVIPEGTAGGIMVLQTAGESLRFNPHLHSLITDGAMLPDDTFHRLPYFSNEKFSEVFSVKVLALMHRVGLIDYDRIELIQTWEHSGFSVWGGPPIESDEAVKFIARYMDRGPVSLQKLSIEDSLVAYLVDDGRAGQKLDPLEFLARLQAHIPDKWESTVRYFGIYSHRYRGEERKIAAAAAAEGAKETGIQTVTEPPGKASRTWAACMKRIFEVDPLVCPKCNSQMKIIAFITDPKELAAISKSLGVEPFEKPQKVRAPPAAETVYEPFTDDTLPE